MSTKNLSSSQEHFEQYIKAPFSDEIRAGLWAGGVRASSPGAFDDELAFGTGGVRAVVGHGTNRLNAANIARLSAALATAFESQKGYSGHENESFFGPLHSSEALSTFIIAFDSRLSSDEFSHITYHLLKNRGHQVKIFDRPTPTPLLSYAVRKLGADAGVVITASHNPPEYNGYKVYGPDGGQIVSPYDQLIEKCYAELGYEKLPAGLFSWGENAVAKEDFIGKELVSLYLDDLQKEGFFPESHRSSLPILYSPLHGTGAWVYEAAFERFGYENFQVLNSQKEPDGNFPTVKSPNPEEPGAFELLEKEGLQHKIPLLLASDPDADRIGCAVYQDEGYCYLNGNETGSILTERMIQARKDRHQDPFICKTIVTTLLQNRIAKAHGVRVVETLTGFKHIAAQIEKDPDNYLFGGEESFGYLPMGWVRDKDSVSSALLIAQAAEEVDLPQELDRIFIQYGLFHDELVNIKLDPQQPEFVEKVMNKIKNPDLLALESLAGRQIIDRLELAKGSRAPRTPEAQKLKESLPPSPVLQYWLSPEGRLTVRPSGTEPKVKIYISLAASQKVRADTLPQAKKELAAEAKSILKEFQERLYA